MAKAYMCDRCEQMFGGEPYKSIPYFVDSSRVVQTFELCEDCARDMVEFVHNAPLGIDLETVSEIKAALKKIEEELILPAGYKCTCSNCVHIYVCDQPRECNQAPHCQQFIPKDKVARYEGRIISASSQLMDVIRKLESYF